MMIDLVTPVISDCCLEEIKLVSLFSGIIISACVSLLSKDEGGLLSYLEVVEASVSSVSWFLLTFLLIDLEMHLTVLPD